MKQKILIIILIVALSGCQYTNDNKGLVSSVISQEDMMNENIVTVSLLHSFQDPGSIEWVKQVTETYTEKNPTIVFDIFAVSPDEYDNVLQKNYASGTMPDLYFMNNRLSDTVLIEDGFAMELTQQAFMRENFVGGSLEGVEYKNSLWAVPIDWNGYGVIYNKLVFKGAEVESIPSTHSEFIEALEQIKKAGYIPLAAGFADSNRMVEDLQVDLSQSSYFNNTDWRISIEKDLYLWEDNFFRFSDALERLSQRLGYYDGARYELSWNEAAEKIANYEAAMIMGDFSTIDTIRSYKSDVPLGMFIFPWSENINKNNFPLKTNGGLAANAKSENVSYLMDILQYFSTAEVGDMTQTYKKSLSVIENVSVGSDPAYDEVLSYIEEGRKTGFSKFRTNFTNPELELMYRESIVRFFYSEDQDVETTVQQMDVETQKVILSNSVIE